MLLSQLVLVEHTSEDSSLCKNGDAFLGVCQSCQK